MKKNEKGFGAVEGLLVLVFVGLLGFVGWYVWHNRATKAPSSPATSTTSQKTTTTTTPAKPTTPVNTDSYTVISEWGVKVKNPQGDTITYTYKDKSGDYPAKLEVRTKKLDALSGNCKNNSVYITRGTAKQVYSPAVLETPASTFEQAYNTWKTSQHAGWYSVGVKVGDNYYLVDGEPGTTCSNNITEENTIWAIIGQAFNNIQTN